MTPSIEVYTPAQVATILKTNREKVYELIRSGELKAFKIDRQSQRFKISSDAVREFITRQEAQLS